jgi:hypothetical protein
MTSLLVPADELINRGGVAISGFGLSRRASRRLPRQLSGMNRDMPHWVSKGKKVNS